MQQKLSLYSTNRNRFTISLMFFFLLFGSLSKIEDETEHLSLLEKSKATRLRGLLCRWPSITEWEMYITAQGPRLRNDLYCDEWDVKLYYTIPCHT